MSGFNVRISFAGICAFVPNTSKDPDVRCKMCVVLPDGSSETRVIDDPDRLPPDGARLKRHRSFLQFSPGQVKGTGKLPPDAVAIWYLNRQRVTFRVVQDGGAAPFAHGLSHQDKLARLEEVAPNHVDEFPDIVSSTPPKIVAAQVLLEKGTFSVDGSKPKLRSWSFPGTLSGAASSRTLSHDVFVEIANVTEFEAIVTAFEGDAAGNPPVEHRFPFKPVGAEDVEITIANLCDENPLRWPTKEGKIPDDQDFRWYYMLLSPEKKAEIADALFGLPLPFPTAPLTLDGNGDGTNCYNSELKGREIDLDAFLPPRT